MKNLTQKEVAEFLKLKKDRLEKISNFIEVAIEMAVETKNDREYKAMIEMSDKAGKEFIIVCDEIELVETVDNVIRAKESDSFISQFTELSTEDVEKANNLVADFISQIEL